jgi:hypothetical protein
VTPHEHYREAERLLGVAANADAWARPLMLAAAQVHATLATTHLTIEPEARP